MRPTLGMVLVMALGMATPARAQNPFPPPRPFAPSPRPTVSPYINLLNPFNSPALNYYGQVRPQFELRADLNQLNRQIRSTQDDVREGGAAPVTGHRSYFFNYAPYFSGLGTTGASATGSSVAPPTPPTARAVTPPTRGARR